MARGALHGAAAIALVVGGLLGGMRLATPPPPLVAPPLAVAPVVVAQIVSAPAVSLWTPVAPGSPLAFAVDVAFAAGGFLSTDGSVASLGLADGSVRAVEVAAPVRRVFAAAGRLFAQSESEGAPLLIALFAEEAPLVVPLPCALALLAGEGEHFAGACESGEALAVSRDGARTFALLPVTLPPLKGESDAVLEALAMNGEGTILLGAARRWVTAGAQEDLLWTLGQIGVRAPGRLFRFASVAGLSRFVGVRMDSGVGTAAGFEFAAAGPASGELHPRLFRTTELAGFAPFGSPGPSCSDGGKGAAARGILLGPREAAFLCGGGLALTVDGGQSFHEERLPGEVTALFGGDLRLLVKAGTATLERRFLEKDASGATAVRVPRGKLKLPPASEKSLDGGAGEAPLARGALHEPPDGGGR